VFTILFGMRSLDAHEQQYEIATTIAQATMNDGICPATAGQVLRWIVATPGRWLRNSCELS
jgi:hypothetical protein